MSLIHYTEGVILPDGQYLPMEGNHLETLLKISKLTKEEAWEKVREGESLLFWLIAYTGCAITDLNCSVGVDLTEKQSNTYRKLVEKGTITDKFYNISSRKEKLLGTNPADENLREEAGGGTNVPENGGSRNE